MPGARTSSSRPPVRLAFSHISATSLIVIDALPPPQILTHLAGSNSQCVIGHRDTDDEAGNFTTARCNGRTSVIARDWHGDTIRRVDRCSIMLMIEGVQRPELLHVSNCGGSLKVRHTGDMWTRQLLAATRVAPSRLERVLYEPVAKRPTCYRISIAFTPPVKPTDTPLGERSAVRCDRWSY